MGKNLLLAIFIMLGQKYVYAPKPKADLNSLLLLWNTNTKLLFDVTEV